MEQSKVKGIPYGVANFEQLRNENLYYVDKTMYLPLLENMSNYLFLIRPRRFGKSVFVSMMRDYYDIAKADRFDTLFNGLWIKEHPTPLKNAFQVIYFDFSLAGAGMENLTLLSNNTKRIMTTLRFKMYWQKKTQLQNCESSMQKRVAKNIHSTSLLTSMTILRM